MKAAFALAGLALLASSGARSKWGGARHAQQKAARQLPFVKARVIGTIRELPTDGMFCLFSLKDGYEDPVLDAAATFRPLVCFQAFSEALRIPDDEVPLVQGVNSRGTKRNVVCISKKLGAVSASHKRSGGFDIAQVRECFNRTFQGGTTLWDYGPDEVEKWETGLPSKVPDPEPLT